MRRAAVLALAVTAAAVAAGGTLSADASRVRSCHAVVDHGVLPPWTRTGFSDPRPRMAHTVARGRGLAALIFGDPLLSPPSKTRSNKILWVSRFAWSPQVRDLRLRAQRMRGTRAIGRPVTRAVPGGPGPSIIDLPASGCWRVNASWGPHRDQLDLYYHRN